MRNKYKGDKPLPPKCMEDINRYTIDAREKKRRSHLKKRWKNHYEPKDSHEDYNDMVTCIYVDD